MKLPAPPRTQDPQLESYLNEVSRLVYYEGPTEMIHGWLADDKQEVILGKIPYNVYVARVHIHVTEAFNSDGTDLVTVGWDADPDALATSADVSTTGVKSLTLGANEGFNSTEKTVKAFYSNGGSEPTTGKAIVIVEFFRVQKEIS